ncbi:MAG TPA: F0F1 ATP synthase subunit A, partial [Candidatus Didemnitutus sp.]
MMLHTHKILGAFLGLGLASAASASEGVATKAEALFHAGPFPITNSMVTSWVVAVALIVAVRLAIKTPKLVPSRGQAIVESLVSSIYDLVAPIVGRNAIKAAFPVLIGLFTYILIQNWSGLVPGVGTVFMKDARGDWMEFVRPAHADMNGT